MTKPQLSNAAKALLQRFVDDPDLCGVGADDQGDMAAELREADLLRLELRLTPRGEKMVRKLRRAAAHAEGERVKAEELAKAEEDVARLRRAAQ